MREAAHYTPHHHTSPPRHYSCIYHPPTLIDQLQSHHVRTEKAGDSDLGGLEANQGGHRARKSDIKRVEAVGSKMVGKKRGADEGEGKATRKRLKSGTAIKEEAKKETVIKTRQDQVFRFMDLPGGKQSDESHAIRLLTRA
jgi:hypothetical protein